MRLRKHDTIDFQAIPICPECGHEISTDDIVVAEDSAYCSSCHREMSFADVADYSLVQAKKKEPLPPGFSVISDDADSLTLAFKSVRLGLRLLGVLISLLLTIPISWIVYHMAAGHCKSYSLAVGVVIGLALVEVWILLCLRNEWKLQMVFHFKRGQFSYSVHPTFFRPFIRSMEFDRDTVFGMAPSQIHVFSPSRPPTMISLPLPMTAEQMFHLYYRLVDFKYGITVGGFKVGPPNPSRRPLQPDPKWKVILHWSWLVFVVVIFAAKIILSLLGIR